MSHHLRLGVDLGGTKIEAAIIDDRGERIAVHRAPTPAAEYGAILEEIARVCEAAERSAQLIPGRLPLGIGTPGSLSPASGLLRNSNTVVLNGRPLRADLERHTGRAVRIANDADCFALSESRDGAGRDGAVLFGVILGTGVGGGITVAGKLLAGPCGISGEWGHNRLPLERVSVLPRELRQAPRQCYCGRTDCIETWLSGPGLALTHELLHGEPLDLGLARGAEFDEQITATLDSYTAQLAAALASVINILDPDVIVLGGGLSNLTRLYEALPPALEPQLFSDHSGTSLRRALHGDSSGVRGAAWLWP